MTRQLSLRMHLTLWYSAVLSFGLILFSLTVWLALSHLLYGDLTTALTNLARGFEEYLHIEERDPAVDLVREMDEYSQSLPQEHLIAVYQSAGKLLYTNSPGAARMLVHREQLLESRKPQRLHWHHRDYFALSHTIALRSGPVHAFLAISSDSTDRAVFLLKGLFYIAVPVFVAGAGLGGYWLSRRALRPVDEITARARTIGVGNLSDRLAVPETHDELQRLTETWNDMLERLERAVSRISRFTADASHELRTPVAIIRLAAENALRRSRSAEEYRAALERIQFESESMTRLIEDLLFLARTDVESTQTARLEPIELRDLVTGVCLDLGPLAAQKQHTFEQQLPTAPVVIKGDYLELRRMLVILLDNAIKYTQAGGTISVSLERDQEQALLRVKDTGIGIPESEQNRVFQRFFRVDPSRSKDSGGYGLGLAIAQAIIDRHNASIALEQNAGGGCIFSVSWPVAA